MIIQKRKRVSFEKLTLFKFIKTIYQMVYRDKTTNFISKRFYNI